MMMDNQTNEFSACETTAEVYVVVFRLMGLDAVDSMLGRLENTREELRRDADGFEAIGMKTLASVLRKHARKAKRAAPRPRHTIPPLERVPK
jgi:hypothetical protein